MGKGELVLWRRGEGKRGGLKTLMVTIETEIVKTKKITRWWVKEAGNDAFTHMKMYTHDKTTPTDHHTLHYQQDTL